jgi:acetyl esterase/lipase
MPRFAAFALSVITLATLLGGCSPFKIIDRLTPDDTYVAALDIAYGSDPVQKIDVYQPLPGAGDGRAQRHPVVVFVHGGTWNSGARRDYRFVGEALAARGIVTIVVGSRLYPQVRYPDFLTDCAAALALALREAPHHGGDVKRLFLMGHSSGAYNAAMLALDARWLAAQDPALTPAALAGWIGLAGPYDFYPIVNPQAKPVFNHPDYPPDSQPIAFASKAAPRTFLGAAETDDLVNPERNSKQLAAKLQAAGVPVTLKIYPRANHYTMIGVFARPLRWLEPVLDDVAAFVNDSPALP